MSQKSKIEWMWVPVIALPNKGRGVPSTGLWNRGLGDRFTALSRVPRATKTFWTAFNVLKGKTYDEHPTQGGE